MNERGDHPSRGLCDDSRLLPAEELSQLAELQSDLDQPLESILSIPLQLLLVRISGEVSLDIHPDGSTLTTGTRQPPDDTGSVLKGDDLSLVLADASVDRVGVVEVISLGDLEAGAGRLGLVFGTDERTGADRLLELIDKLLSGSGFNLLVVVTGEEGTTVDLVVSQENIIDADQFVGRLLVSSGEDVEPG